MTESNVGMGVYRPATESFGQFVWNSNKNEFLGRNAASWGKIGFFYLIFYSCLAGFFAAMLAVFYQTLDTENRPTYTPGPGGSILRNPALGFRPKPRPNNIESTLIWYKNGDNKDIEHWVTSLNEFIKPYEGTDDDGQHTRDCSFIEYEKEKAEEKDGKPRETRACKFDDSWLDGYCNKAESWGFNRESPCIILKLNKMINWEPDVYTELDQLPSNMPAILQETIKNYTINDRDGTAGKIPPMVWVSCEGENPADKEYLPKIDLSPFPGFPAYYFPYTKVPGYRSPLIGVQILKPQPNVLINIECRIWAKNIKHDKGNRLGLVHFELLQD